MIRKELIDAMRNIAAIIDMVTATLKKGDDIALVCRRWRLQ